MQKFIREWGEALLVALVLTFVLRTFVVQAFKIPSGSMEDTLLIGDYLLVNKFIYGTRIPLTSTRVLELRQPDRGDVVVFAFPIYRGMEDFNVRNPGVAEDIRRLWLGETRPRTEEVDFIKRIIGLPGDVVEVRDRQVFINSQPLRLPQEVHKSPYTLPADVSPRDTFGPVTVPPGHYFVMGDNRDFSADSRFWGFVPRGNIHGLAFVKYWSWDAARFLPRVDRLLRPID